MRTLVEKIEATLAAAAFAEEGERDEALRILEQAAGQGGAGAEPARAKAPPPAGRAR